MSKRAMQVILEATHTAARKALHQFGPWAGIRFLANSGVPFEVAYQARFGRAPHV